MKQENIDSIMSLGDVYFGELFGPGEAWTYASSLEDALNSLSAKQVQVLADYVKENGMNVNVGHDVFGIINRDRHFLPRIKALQEVTPYLT